MPGAGSISPAAHRAGPGRRHAPPRARAQRPPSAPDRVHTYKDPLPMHHVATEPADRRTRSRSRSCEWDARSICVVDATINDVMTVPDLVDSGAERRLDSSILHEARHPVSTRRAACSGRRPRTASSTARCISLRSIEIAGARVDRLSATIDPVLDFGSGQAGRFFNGLRLWRGRGTRRDHARAKQPDARWAQQGAVA